MHARRQLSRLESVPVLFEERHNRFGSHALSSDLLAPRNLLMTWGFALFTAVVFKLCLLLSLFRSSVAAIIVLIARTVVVATIAASFFAWPWTRP